MSGRCGHRGKRNLRRPIVVYLNERRDFRGAMAEVNICEDCGEWLTLGHSDESPERVALEIRAAEIAWGGPLGVSETIGWFDCIGGRDWDESADAQWKAGYLGRLIGAHSTKETP